jgi:hypothetical protein
MMKNYLTKGDKKVDTYRVEQPQNRSSQPCWQVVHFRRKKTRLLPSSLQATTDKCGALSRRKHKDCARRSPVEALAKTGETLERSLNVLNSGRCKTGFIKLNHKLTDIPVTDLYQMFKNPAHEEYI